ncbi:MAG TPA: 2Fe-2S iron-sulfur cluster-binding protein [Chloroflexota bacterium]|nr:2Fe-2S iron-sulfur cluster-binding protein [Chloroflexota bacterium]
MAGTVRVTVQRFNPEHDAAPHYETYEVPVRDTTSVTNVLYDVNAIHGAAIAYRVSCHRGICASCRMKVNGKARLACCHPVDGGEIKLEPSMGFKVIKDLVTESDWKGLGRDDETDELLT